MALRGLITGKTGWSMKTYEEADQAVHDGYLLDIAFEMRQGEIVKKLRAKHFFTDRLFWGFNTVEIVA